MVMDCAQQYQSIANKIHGEKVCQELPILGIELLFQSSKISKIALEFCTYQVQGEVQWLLLKPRKNPLH